MQIAPNVTPPHAPEYGAPTQTKQATTPGYGAPPHTMQNTTPQERNIQQITNVTIQQPQGVVMQRYPRAPENVRDWTTGLFGCFSDIGGCECLFWPLFIVTSYYIHNYNCFQIRITYSIYRYIVFPGCYAMACWSCFLIDISIRMDEDACGKQFCGPMFISHLRTKLRTLYGIRVSVS